MFNVAMKENGTIIQFQDLHQVLTNVYVDYQLLKTRGRATRWSAPLSSRRFIPRISVATPYCQLPWIQSESTIVVFNDMNSTWVKSLKLENRGQAVCKENQASGRRRYATLLREYRSTCVGGMFYKYLSVLKRIIFLLLKEFINSKTID